MLYNEHELLQVANPGSVSRGNFPLSIEMFQGIMIGIEKKTRDGRDSVTSVLLLG